MSKRRIEKFNVVSAVKSNARDTVGRVRSGFAILPKSKRPARHKKNLLRVIHED